MIAVARDESGTYFPTHEQYLDLVAELKDSGFEYCSDLCGVDYLSYPERQLPESITAQRFEVVVNLTSIGRGERVKIRVQIPEAKPEVPSLFDIYPGTEAMEREAYDLVGITFAGHPDPSRILLPEGWEGHPLRKDYSVGRIPVQFKSSQSIR